MQARHSIYLALLAGLAGCATLPSTGPTGRQIEKSASAPKEGPAIRIVQVSTVADVPEAGAGASPETLLPELAPPPTDMIGPGDILDINIYEAGVTLFSGATAGAASGQLATSPGVQVQNITVPYAGTLHVAGITTGEVEAMIRHSLERMSQNPQVLVTLSQAITNSIIVGGEVANPGRLVLQTNRETLSDAVALAGGYRGNAKDLTLRVVRGGRSADFRVNDLVTNPKLDIRAYPGDRLMLINDPRTYSVLGASGKVEQQPFSRSSVSLAEAIANAGGAHPSIGDPAAIFLFRYRRDAQGNEVPVVYHLNMMKTGSYFLAQRFAMQDKDVLYFGTAAANQPSKVIQLISQLFSPILTVTAAVRTIQN